MEIAPRERRRSTDSQTGDAPDIQVHRFEPAMKEKSNVLRQYFAAFAANLAALSCGCVLGWTSPVTDELNSLMSKGEVSWVASLVAAGAMIGPFVAGWAADRFGRKMTILAQAPIFLVSWVILSLCTVPWAMFLARILQGLALGSCFTVVPMYVGEISEDSVRGALGSFMQLLITVGFLYVYGIGPFIPYKTYCWIQVPIPAIFFAVFFFIPESPYYLLSKGSQPEAQRSLMWLRGLSASGVKEEMEEMQVAVDKAAEEQGSIRDLISIRANKKALILSLGLVSGQQLSGINAVLFFTTQIFKMSGGSLKPAIATIIVGVVMFLASAVCPMVVDRLGRRMLLLASAVGMTLSQGVLGVYFYLHHNGTDVSKIGWLPVVCLMIYVAIYSVGFGALPWAVMGELFPANVKGIASSITASFCWFLGFLITKFFDQLQHEWGGYTAFWIFTVFCVLAGIFVFFLLPETKGKSLAEIQSILDK